MVPNRWLPLLSEAVAYEQWGYVDEGHTAIRFVCSWASREESVEELLSVLKELSNSPGI